jgi:pyruvate/2-oxoglutarate dehydrogenase complex dihydrolipoamide dehydrogenase (E3) component
MPTKAKPSGRVTHMFDVVVIGSGAAGIAAVEGARAAGIESVCLIEAETELGGECVRWACVPTKVMLKSAQLYHQAKFDLARYGVQTRDVSFDFKAIARRRQAVIETLTGQGKRLATLLKRWQVTVKHGQAKFVDAHTLEVAGQRVRGRAFVIATGSRERVPDIDGLDTVPVWYSRDLAQLQAVPKSLAIIGGGPIGAEAATLFGLLGVKTILLEVGEHILPREDREIAVLAESHLRHLGVHVITKTKTLGVRRQGRNLKLTYQTGRRPRQSVSVERVLVAVGRQPNVAHLDLDQAGLKLSPTETLPITATLHTKKNHILAAGDAASHLQFTALARQHGYVAGWNAAQVTRKGKVSSADTGVLPRITFVEPEIASVGLTVQEATRAGKTFRVLRMPFAALGRAAVDGQRDGVCKILIETKSEKILGAHILGERAGEIIHELALAIQVGVPFTTVQAMLHAYPSWSEIIPAATD